MSSHFYEVALFGEFFARDLKAILNRITLHSESSHLMHSREILFEPLDAQYSRDTGSEPVLLRAKKDLFDPGLGWCVERCLSRARTYKHNAVGSYIRISSLNPCVLTPRQLSDHGLRAKSWATR
jgi:hypothetical protein